jgi:hypothetical protein
LSRFCGHLRPLVSKSEPEAHVSESEPEALSLRLIWNLATPNIKGFFYIEAFDIECCFDIEYTTFDIELLASISKLTKNFDIKENSISMVQPSKSESYIKVLRY